MSSEGGRRAGKSLTLGDVGHFSGGPPIEAVRQMVDERVLIGAVEPPGGHR
jgi:hypothetical protein